MVRIRSSIEFFSTDHWLKLNNGDVLVTTSPSLNALKTFYAVANVLSVTGLYLVVDINILCPSRS